MTEESWCLARRSLFEKCAEDHPHIVAPGEGAGGVPYLEGTSLTVCRILERLYVHGSIAAVTDYYRDVTEEQVKDAIAYALTFIETACANAPPGRD